MPVSLDGAMLFVKDLPRMTRFYADVLGLQPIEATRLPDWVEFDGDGARFSLHGVPAPIAATMEIDSPPRAREQSAAKLTFSVPDVESTLAAIAAAGLPVFRRPWGGTEACDPEGNVIGLRTAPPRMP
jgi:catechol 2,3-dioxygenase-like lactoylglutathione lyase family enzyme